MNNVVRTSMEEVVALPDPESRLLVHPLDLPEAQSPRSVRPLEGS
jgi:hypothetical protein